MGCLLKIFTINSIVFIFKLIVTAGLCHAGMVSITFDDGLESVYTYAFPVLHKHKQVATVGIVFKAVVSGSPDYMTVSQIMELQRNGWEIASHSLTHTNPKKIPRRYNQEPITGWTLENEKPPIYQTQYKYKALAGLLESGKIMKGVDSLNKITVSPGCYYFDPQTERLHIYPFSSVETEKMDIRTISFQREMELSKKELEKLGFKISTYITPFNYWNDELENLSLNVYDYVATGKRKVNLRETFDAHYIKRFEVNTDDAVNSLEKLVMENAVSKDGWIIFDFHGIGDGKGWKPWSEEKLEQFSIWLQLMRIKIVTIAEGASVFK